MKALNRAPSDHEVLKHVRNLADADRASAIMGNHELNAILYHRRKPCGVQMCKHSEGNQKQHESDGSRLVIAYWSDSLIGLIRARSPDGRLRSEDLLEIAEESTEFGRAVKRLTSGPEAKLPGGQFFIDWGGKQRDEIRLCWWTKGGTWKELALSLKKEIRDTLPSDFIPKDCRPEPYPETAPPVFIGHYKMEGDPAIAHSKVASLDCPDIPCVYFWNGETDLKGNNLMLLK